MNRKREDTINKTSKRTLRNDRTSGKTTPSSVAALGLIAMLVAALFFVPYIHYPAGAVHTSPTFFELGPFPFPQVLPKTASNTANIDCGDSGTTGIDWGRPTGSSLTCNIFGAGGVPVLGFQGGVFAVFDRDDTSQASSLDRTTYSGAGSSNKNNDPISAADCAARGILPADCKPWQWDSGNVPAKDDLVNTYAYFKIDGSGHMIVYAGVERLAPEGDSHIDIELLQSAISIVDPNPSGAPLLPCNDPGSDPTPCQWDGIRTDGDLIVSMDFLQGGALGTVTVHEWLGNGYVEPPIISLTGEGCNPAAGSIPADTICAFNNGAPIDGGEWDNFDRHGAVITTIPTNGFSEFGFDIFNLLGENPCISTFLPKTRSSQSFTAELKDFGPPASVNICGGNISILPDGVNEVDALHTFTVNVTQKVANISNPAPDGTAVDVLLTPSNGATVNGSSSPATASCTTLGGVCSVSVFSNTTGLITAHANATLSIGLTQIPLETDGSPGNSGDAVKRFIDSKIDISPDAVNDLRDNNRHTFNVTVMQDDGDGAGFVASTDGHVDFLLTGSGGATPVLDAGASTCDDAGDNLDSNGQCTIVFTSATTGTVTGNATATLMKSFAEGNITVTRSTDGTGLNSDPSVKRFVNATISIAPDDVNSIEETHTFTVTVLQDTGDGSGLVVATVGHVNFTLAPSGGASANLNAAASTCDDAGDNLDSSGQCTIVFTSPTAGTVTGSATVTLDFTFPEGNIILTRTTGTAGNGANAVKIFVDGSISWRKVDNLGKPLDGATFEVCRIFDLDTGTGTYTATNVCFSVTDDIAPDTDAASGFLKVEDLRLGNYTVHETVPPPGFVADPSTKTANLTLAQPDFDIPVAFGDERPILKITGCGYENTQTSTPSQNDTAINGTVTYTCTIHNYGGANGYLNLSLVVSVTGADGGILDCTGFTGPNGTVPTTLVGCTLTATEVLVTSGGDVTFTLTADYTNMPNGAEISATLNGTYNTAPGDTFIRTVNGSPATLTFTVRPN